MFSHIDLKGLATSAQFGYAKDLPFFQGKKKIAFKPGLNILVGANGTGKSTVLRMLAESTCCFQGGVSAITEGAVHQGVDMLGSLRLNGGSGKHQDKMGLKVHHDGQPVVFSDPRQTVGLDGGAFDDDFFTQGLAEVTSGRKKSHGQLALWRTSQALAVLEDKRRFPKDILRKMKKSNVNSVWVEAIEVLEKRLEASIAKGQPSVLLDEPEANFSLVWQARLWSKLGAAALAKNFQIIVATHSAFALGIAHANYIDVAPGFRQEAEEVLRQRFAPQA